MHIIMCSQPLNDKIPHEMYLDEYNSAKKFADVHLFNFHYLDTGELNKILPKLSGTGEDIIYNGWMMNLKQYEQFYNVVKSRGFNLINTPEQYINCHHFDNWYSAIAEHTPKSIIVDAEELRPMIDATMKFQKEMDSALIIKDSVSSLKHHWYEACFISENANPVNIAKILATFVEYKNQYNDFQGNLIVRQFVELDNIGTYSKSDMPISEEYRAFFFKGNMISIAPYWEEGEYGSKGNKGKLYLLAKEVAKKIYEKTGNNFFTVDIARLLNGEWICMEVGDGQVSSIPTKQNKDQFYSELKKINEKRS